MKVKIEVEKRYKITIGDVTHTNFKKISEWEGMVKFQNENGVVIVDQGTPNIFANILNMAENKLDHSEGVEVELCKASPDLFHGVV